LSDFIAEATVRIRPDTTRFRATLQEEINRAISQVAAVVPVTFAATGGAGVAGTVTALSAAQAELAQSTQTVTGLAQVENTTFARQAVILQAATVATQQKAGADRVAAGAARDHAVAQSQVGKAAVASTAGMLGLRGAVLTAGTAFIAATVGFQALGKAIGSTIDFERELNVFKVTAGATADEMKRVSDVARELGRDITLPGVAANDAAQTLTELSKAGLSVQESLDAARGTLQLATAAQIDNAQAAELVANSLNAFQLEGSRAVDVADLLAGAANASQGSITDMGLALKQAASVARLTGLSVEETVTLLTELSKAGLSASDAGTSLRTTLLRLVGDFPKVQAEVKRLGLELRDVNGNIRPEFFSDLGTKLRNMAPAARQATVALLGGSDAIRAIGILSRSSAADFQELLNQISQSGTAQEVAAAQTQGLGGDVEAAKNQFADLGLTVGQVAKGPLSLFVQTAGAAAGAINSANQAVAESAGGGGFFATFGDLLDGINDSFSDLNISFQQGVRAAQAAQEPYNTLDDIFENVRDHAKEARDAVTGLNDAVSAGGSRGQAEGLDVKQLQNRLKGFDSAELAARIRGDDQALLAVLESERAFLEGQLQRQFVRRRPDLFRQIQQALFGTVNDISTITKQGAAEATRSAAEAKRSLDQADSAFLDLLGNRRDDQERRIEAAAATSGLQDDIRAQNNLQALIQQQIKKIRDRVKDEQARKAAIRELRIALIASRREEEALRQEQKQQAQEQATQILDIKIEIAEAKGQVALERQLLNEKIRRLKAQIKAAKGNRLLVAQLRLELAQTQKQLEDLNQQQEDTNKAGKTLAQSQFEFMQSLQGFSANLLGNLIPGFATTGLVGNPSTGQGPTAGLKDSQQRVSAAADVRGARDRGVRPIQVDTTNQLLRSILRVLQGTHTRLGHPEAHHNRHIANAQMDTLADHH